MNVTEQLKPCPFCGEPVELEQTETTFDSAVGYRRWWGVCCRSTRNHGGSCAVQIRPSASKEAAIARWNTRAQPAQASQEVRDAMLSTVGAASMYLTREQMLPFIEWLKASGITGTEGGA